MVEAVGLPTGGLVHQLRAPLSDERLELQFVLRRADVVELPHSPKRSSQQQVQERAACGARALHVARSMALVLRLTATGASLVGIGQSFLLCAVRLAL
jgi:hypothetical protein